MRALCIVLIFHVTFNVIVTVSNAAIYSSNTLWKTYLRPSWSGNVTVTYDEWNDDSTPGQIWKVEGIVVPLSTTGRPSAPKPFNKFPTGTEENLDKGHVLALSNGGIDTSYNIVPQTAQWQRTGGWRIMEITVYEYAQYKYNWTTVSLAANLSSIAEPDSCLVLYTVSIKSYNLATGEPTLYDGTVQCGVEKYSFQIQPPIEGNNDSAVWSPIRPPSDSSTASLIRDLFAVPSTTQIQVITATEVTDIDTDSDDHDDTNAKEWFTKWQFIAIFSAAGALVVCCCVIGTCIACKKYRARSIIKQNQALFGSEYDNDVYNRL